MLKLSSKKNKHVPKYKHNHIDGNYSSSTLNFITFNVEEKCTPLNQIN